MKKALFYIFLGLNLAGWQNSIAQTKNSQINYSEIIPESISVKPLTAPISFLDNSIRLSIIDFLKLKNINPSNYFVESSPIKDDKTSISIPLWHIEGLKKMKEIEKKNKETKQKNSWIGNPGECGTIKYDKKQQKIISFLYWR